MISRERDNELQAQAESLARGVHAVLKTVMDGPGVHPRRHSFLQACYQYSTAMAKPTNMPTNISGVQFPLPRKAAAPAEPQPPHGVAPKAALLKGRLASKDQPQDMIEAFWGLREPAPQVKQDMICCVPACCASTNELRDISGSQCICETHRLALSVMIDGQIKRFCQSCACFHELREFDGRRSSCRKLYTAREYLQTNHTHNSSRKLSKLADALPRQQLADLPASSPAPKLPQPPAAVRVPPLTTVAKRGVLARGIKPKMMKQTGRSASQTKRRRIAPAAADVIDEEAACTKRANVQVHTHQPNVLLNLPAIASAQQPQIVRETTANAAVAADETLQSERAKAAETMRRLQAKGEKDVVNANNEGNKASRAPIAHPVEPKHALPTAASLATQAHAKTAAISESQHPQQENVNVPQLLQANQLNMAMPGVFVRLPNGIIAFVPGMQAMPPAHMPQYDTASMMAAGTQLPPP